MEKFFLLRTSFVLLTLSVHLFIVISLRFEASGPLHVLIGGKVPHIYLF